MKTHKQYLWMALIVLTLSALACQFLLPEETPTPVPPATAPHTAAPHTATSPARSGDTRTATPASKNPTSIPRATSTRSSGATPAGMPSSLLRDPVTDADRATVKALAEARADARNLRDLAIRLKGLPADTPAILCTSTPNYAVGTTRILQAQNQSTQKNFDVNAVLRYKNDAVNMWVSDKVKVGDDKIKQAADYFAQKIYPTNRALLGSEASPGIDCDPRVSILNTPGLGGAAGYVAGKDFVTKAVRPDSNEMELIYMSTDALDIGSDEYLGVLAHEFQHVIAANTHKNLDTWMNEGFSDLVIALNGFGVGGHPSAFLAAPNTQLNAWDELERSIPHYGASFMFMNYFYNRFGTDGTKKLIADQSDGLTALNNTISQIKPGMTVEAFFADWQIANYLNDPKVEDGRFAYKDFRFNQPRTERTVSQYPFTLNGAVNHWASQYFVLQGQRDVTVSFTGATKARLLAFEPRGQAIWYSGRGDDSVFSLTREFDLSSATAATLKFWTWYDVEEDWDYFYVEVSTDGGKTWKILKTPGSRDTNPNGNSYGRALTGKSGGKKQADWAELTVDLKEFAGKKIALRFEYITDDALNYPGVALHEIRIPEINYTYTPESGNGGWQAVGFIRTNNLVPEKYSVQLIGIGTDGKTQVKRLAVADDQTGQWTVPLSQLKNAVLVFSAFARTTTEPAPYQLKISE